MSGILGCVNFWKVLGGVSGLREIARKIPYIRSVRLHDEKKLFLSGVFGTFLIYLFQGLWYNNFDCETIVRRRFESLSHRLIIRLPCAL